MGTEFAFRCAKLQGCGNSFVVLIAPPGALLDWPMLARRACNPRTGIGSDGLLVVRAKDGERWPVEMWNPDGSRMGMCGNGIRCITRFLIDEGLAARGERILFTVAGRELACEDLPDRQIRVDMGLPSFQPHAVPVASADEVFDQQLEVDGVCMRISALTMGNPHCVIFDSRHRDLDPLLWGPRLECHPLFPDRANVSFADALSRSHVALRVWERGAGATLACGTAACATVVTGVRLGLCDRNVQVTLPGGDLRVEWSSESGRVMLTGPAEPVREGYIAYSALKSANEEVRWSARA